MHFSIAEVVKPKNQMWYVLRLGDTQTGSFLHRSLPREFLNTSGDELNRNAIHVRTRNFTFFLVNF